MFSHVKREEHHATFNSLVTLPKLSIALNIQEHLAFKQLKISTNNIT